MTIRPYKTIYPTIDKTAYIDPMALVIGDVVIGKQASVWPMAVIRGDVNYIRIGDYTNIQDGCVLHVSHASPQNGPGYALIIGNYVTVGHKVTLHACQVDDYSLVGIGSIILDGAHIQSKVVVGAGTLVPPGKVLESGYLYLGQPAKKIRVLTQEELEFFEYSASYYAKLKEDY